MRLTALLSLLMLSVSWLSGCKNSADIVEPHPDPEVSGAYVGATYFNGSLENVRLLVSQDTAQAVISGSIRYDGVETAIGNAYTDSDKDTLWFTYQRGTTLYRVWAGIFDTGLEAHYLEPGGITMLVVNREYADHNLSGHWTGTMSNNLGMDEPAEFDADQRGGTFRAVLNVTFLESFNGYINQGVVDGNNLALGGTGSVGGVAVNLAMNGVYTSANTYAGTWNAAGNGYEDSGAFSLVRSFN